MQQAVEQAKIDIDTKIDDFLKQIIIMMETNKNLIYRSLDLQLDKFSNFLSGFNQKVDDFVKDSLILLGNSQQQFNMQNG